MDDKLLNILPKVEQFLQEDENSESRQVLEDTLKRAKSGESQAKAHLLDQFQGLMRFGTAGLRGRMEPGLNRMNLITVAKAAYGLAQYLRLQGKVVLAFDARRQSEDFAKVMAHVLSAHGISVSVYPHLTATPVLSFATPYLGSQAGVMVTASHNPPDDNGIKIYGADGAQIVAPFTTQIEEHMAKAPTYQALMSMPEGQIHYLGEELIEAYLGALHRATLHPGVLQTTPLCIAYTPLHGVGYALAQRVLYEAGVKELHVVRNQQKPDGEFPTLAFPNPEEDGAMDALKALASDVKADIALANDPDADRLAVMLFDKGKQDFVALSGNMIGVLLGADALLHSKEEGRQNLAMSSYVSSRMLSVMAPAMGAAYADAVTGFANIMKIALERVQQNNEAFVFGYEEALGYCVSDVVRDKDGIGALLRMAELCAYLKNQGKTLWDFYDDLSLQYGVFVSDQHVLRFDGPGGFAEAQNMMRALRADTQAWLKARKLEAKSIEDCLAHTGDKRSNMLVFTLADDTRILVRPSGTEPKVKFYLEAVAKCEAKEALESMRQELACKLKEISKRL